MRGLAGCTRVPPFALKQHDAVQRSTRQRDLCSLKLSVFAFPGMPLSLWRGLRSSSAHFAQCARSTGRRRVHVRALVQHHLRKPDRLRAFDARRRANRRVRDDVAARHHLIQELRSPASRAPESSRRSSRAASRATSRRSLQTRAAAAPGNQRDVAVRNVAFALTAANRKSHDNASSYPPPAARPSIVAITGHFDRLDLVEDVGKGSADVPTAPGLGVEVDKQRVRALSA